MGQARPSGSTAGIRPWSGWQYPDPGGCGRQPGSGTGGAGGRHCGQADRKRGLAGTDRTWQPSAASGATGRRRR
ncbi:MAG: hypothetical protein F4206_03980 [Gammaproteobacteria bacterium]|nr:hypothetical protein [Gammaproteobacteria bacterium]MYG65877.1 hypothetical protein [Gammaproteobacteria bacterium]